MKGENEKAKEKILPEHRHQREKHEKEEGEAEEEEGGEEEEEGVY